MSKRTKQREPILIGCQQHRNSIKSRFTFKLHHFAVVTTFEKTVAVNLTGKHFNGFGQINDMYTHTFMYLQISKQVVLLEDSTQYFFQCTEKCSWYFIQPLDSSHPPICLWACGGQSSDLYPWTQTVKLLWSSLQCRETPPSSDLSYCPFLREHTFQVLVEMLSGLLNHKMFFKIWTDADEVISFGAIVKLIGLLQCRKLGLQ